MVFTSLVNFARSKGPDEFWRKRKIFKLAAHFVGRKRNCYSIAIRYVHRALVYATTGRKLKKQDMAQLWETRLAAACEEHGFTSPLMKESLSRNNILLNRKSLVELAIWEPRTYQGLTSIAWQKAIEDNIEGIKDLQPPPESLTKK
ncbi:hypothetical protein J437_LFUL015233 [Ladona fulva]|uniref:Ribosomal protein L20 n=1 Tax=Ladona fulva TaxID=123851 RepID=A0A8K0KLP0_LADFU|nr:hypothetical protein J437_LFUL015233 [Ladona fulva]